MKLLNTTGLLFATVSSANVDGNSGAYTMVDWAATFNEERLLEADGTANNYISKTAASRSTIGLAPAVTGIL